MKILLALFFCLLALPVYAVQPPSQYSTGGPGGVGTLTPPMTPYVNSYAVSAGVAETITWPAGALWCNISAGANYWTRVGGTATVPGADITDGTSSTLNAAQRAKGPESSFSIISATSQQVSVEFWGQ